MKGGGPIEGRQAPLCGYFFWSPCAMRCSRLARRWTREHGSAALREEGCSSFGSERFGNPDQGTQLGKRGWGNAVRTGGFIVYGLFRVSLTQAVWFTAKRRSRGGVRGSTAPARGNPLFLAGIRSVGEDPSPFLGSLTPPLPESALGTRRDESSQGNASCEAFLGLFRRDRILRVRVIGQVVHRVRRSSGDSTLLSWSRAPVLPKNEPYLRDWVDWRCRDSKDVLVSHSWPVSAASPWVGHETVE